MSEPIYPQFLSSTQINAPQMGRGEGEMLTVLDAALVTGCCPFTASTVTIEEDLIKITIGILHSYMPYQFVILSGAVSPALNGKHRIVKVEPTAFYIPKGTISDVSGTIKTLLAPLGWESIFGTGSPTKRAYRSLDPSSTKMVLYLDAEYSHKTGAHATAPSRSVKVNICRDMTTLGEQIGSVTEERNAPSLDGVLHFVQVLGTSLTAAAPATPSPWIVVGDKKTFYFLVDFRQSSTQKGMGMYMFGDLPRQGLMDNYRCVFAPSSYAWSSSTTSQYSSDLGTPLNSVNLGSASAYSSTVFTSTIEGATNLDYSFITSLSAHNSGQGVISRLNPLNYGVVMSECHVIRRDTKVYAGALPYLRHIASNMGGSTDCINTHLTQRQGHLFLHLNAGRAGATDNSGLIAVDLLTPRKEDDVT